MALTREDLQRIPDETRVLLDFMLERGIEPVEEPDKGPSSDSLHPFPMCERIYGVDGDEMFIAVNRLPFDALLSEHGDFGQKFLPIQPPIMQWSTSTARRVGYTISAVDRQNRRITVSSTPIRQNGETLLVDNRTWYVVNDLREELTQPAPMPPSRVPRFITDHRKRLDGRRA